MRNQVSLRSFPAARLAAALTLAAGLSACGSITLPSMPSLPGFGKVVTAVTPYRPDIVQGNVVTAEQLRLIRVGSSRSQVRDILGTPLIADPFHADRWDYVFTLNRQGVEPSRRAMVVHFGKDDNVSAIDAPDLPTENDFIASISREPLPTGGPKLELTDAERAALPRPAAVAAPAPAASAATGALRKYPPLESPQ